MKLDLELELSMAMLVELSSKMRIARKEVVHAPLVAAEILVEPRLRQTAWGWLVSRLSVD